MFYFKPGHIVCGTTTQDGERRYVIGTVSQVLHEDSGVKIEITTPGGILHQLPPRDVHPVINVILGKDRKIRQLTAFRYQAAEQLTKVASGGKCGPADIEELLHFFEPKEPKK
jgi:hypothetical protein